MLRCPSPYSYAEVRAEKRRELGIEESQPEMTVEKVRLSQEEICEIRIVRSSHVIIPSQQSQDSGSESQLNTSSLKEVLDRFNHSRTPSASSRSSRKSSHTAVSDPACESADERGSHGVALACLFTAFLCPSPASQMKIQGDRSTPGRQSVSAVEMTSQRRSSISSQVGRRKLSHSNSSLKCSSFFSFILPSAVNELPKHRPEYGTHHDRPTAAAAAAAGATASSEQRPSKTHI